MGTDGTMGKVTPTNVTIPQTPTNYSVLTSTLGGHLSGIDNKLGSIVATTAGTSARVWFTADGTTVGGNPYYQTQITKGTASSAVQSVTNDDNQKKYFTQDIIGAPYATATLFPPGTYAGNLSASTTPNSAQQRWTVELYKCDNSGTPIASGVTGAAVGSLGVTVITILDSGLLTLADGSVTNVQVSGNLGGTGFSINAGERVRYHVSAEKVGTAASNITQSVYYGTSYNSFIDVTVPLNTNSVVNLSTVAGGTTTDALLVECVTDKKGYEITDGLKLVRNYMEKDVFYSFENIVDEDYYCVCFTKEKGYAKILSRKNEYKITKEQISEIEQWGNKSDARKVREWYPDCFKKELIVGKWYKVENIANGSLGFSGLGQYTEEKPESGLLESTDGFNFKQVDGRIWRTNGTITDAEPKEVEEALINYLKKELY